MLKGKCYQPCVEEPVPLKVYLVGALKNKNIPLLGVYLRKQGFVVFDDWYSAGEFADTHWKDHEQLRRRDYRGALAGEHAECVFQFDKRLLDASDAAVLVLPAGKSAYAELGYMRGRDKHTVALLDDPNPERWDVMLKFAQHIVTDEMELVTVLKGLR